MQFGSQDWTYKICKDFLNILDECYNVSVFNNPDAMHKKIFNPFKLNEDSEYVLCVNVDPDNFTIMISATLCNQIVIIVQETLLVIYFINVFKT